MKMTVGVGLALVWTLAIGCAQPVADLDAPGADDDDLDAQATIYSTNAVGTWSATAGGLRGVACNGPYCNPYINLWADFTGPAGYTRKMGVCALKMHGATAAYPSPSEGVFCNTVADCANAPTTLPTGGFRYCTKADGETQKRCFYRPGPQTTYCKGSPVDGNPVPPGRQSVPQINFASGPWMSYACFEGCVATDPSTSTWPGYSYP